MKEIWKDVKGYEGLYQVSNLGRVKSLKRIVKRNGHNYPIKKEVTLSQAVNKRTGYCMVNLYNNGVKVKSVHRLVIGAFLKNIHNKKDTNHKDGIKTNNKLSNLEYATRSENEKHAYRIGLKKNTGCSDVNYTGNNKPVIQYTKDNVFVAEYDSIKDAALSTGGSASAISINCKGTTKLSGGYIWELK